MIDHGIQDMLAACGLRKTHTASGSTPSFSQSADPRFKNCVVNFVMAPDTPARIQVTGPEHEMYALIEQFAVARRTQREAVFERPI